MAKTSTSKTAERAPVLISPDKFDAVLFDMDGVVTRTAAVHFAAWKKIFDSLLNQHTNNGKTERAFSRHDYLAYVDGKPREDGVRSFIESRGISLPEGAADDPAGFNSVCAVARKKNQEFAHLIRTRGVEPYETTVGLIRALRDAGLKTALVTASKNCDEILKVTCLRHLFDAVVDGVDAEKLNLPGKPAPDVFLEAARRVSVPAGRCVVVEDAESGVEAGRNGKFGMVIGVARQHNHTPLKNHGADAVVADLSEVMIPQFCDVQLRGMALADMDVTEANWLIEYDKFIPEQEGRRESLCALGNGRFCTRGAAAESHADGVHYPGTYVAGGYNSIWFDVGDDRFKHEELVNMPNWLCLNFRIDDGDWFDLTKVQILKYSQRLNLREGILYRDVTFKDKAGRKTHLAERRFVHMRHSHLAGLEVEVTAINWSDKLTIRTALDGKVLNDGVKGDRQMGAAKHLETMDRSAEHGELFLKVRTNESQLVVAEAAITRISSNGNPIDEERSNIVEHEYVAQDINVRMEEAQSVKVQKTVALYTSRDKGIYEAGIAAKQAVADKVDFEKLVEEQIQAWRSLWRQFDLFVETTEEHSKLIPSLLLHLNSFHVLQTASPHTVDLDSSVPARGWTGEGYQGHVFWDDLFVFPFVNLRMPNISAALLKYRYRRLPEARKIAQSYGARGACFPWQSASDGCERTPSYWYMEAKDRWIHDFSRLEVHVNGTIAYNVWQYYQVTMDEDFMYSYGAEILFEIARFFASFAKFNPSRGRYDILGVIGPDEFHTAYPGSDRPGINNNAYTNIMATWTLCRALELLKALPADHREHLYVRLGITDEEVSLWEDVSRRLYLPMIDECLIGQFEGYENLKEFPGAVDGKVDHDLLKKTLTENDGYLNDYKFSKQADVLMLTYVFSPDELKELIERLGYPFEDTCIATNCLYYIPRTANDSTLSRVAHAWALSRMDRLPEGESAAGLLGDQDSREELSEQIFYEALGSDYYDVAARGTANSGIHMGAMAGTVDIVQRCFTGIVTRGDVLWLDPHLPKPMMRLSFSIRYRRQALSFDINHEKFKVSAWHWSAKPIKIGYDDQVYVLNAGDSHTIKLTRHTGDPKKI